MKSFCDRDHDLGKSILHVLAQRSPRIPPARTLDQNCPSPSPMHLNVGEIDRTSHIHVPAMTVLSDAPFDDFGHQRIWDRCVSQLCGSTDVVCELPLGLVGSQLLAAAQMKWPSAGSGTEASHAQSLMKIDEESPSCSISPAPLPDAKRPSRASRCQKICR